MTLRRTRVPATLSVVLLLAILAGCPNPNGSGYQFEGDLAIPDLNVTQWITEPRADINHNEPGHVFLLEFWATWCGPCRDTIPHLNEIHRVFGDLITVVAVTDEAPATVSSFVHSMGETMEFAVAVDDTDATWNAYMSAYGQSGIPHAFLIVDGEVVDHFHSASADMTTMGDYLNDAVIQARDEARETVTVSGNIRHNGNSIFSYTNDVGPFWLYDELFARWTNPGVTAGIGYTVNTSTGAYTITNLPRGSYYASVEAGDAGVRDHDPGNYMGIARGMVFSQDSSLDISMVRSIHLTAPHDNSVDFAGYPQTVTAGTVTFSWDAIPGADDYYWYSYKDGVFSDGNTAGTSVDLPIVAGSDYTFDVWAYNGANQIGNLYVYTETSSGGTSAYGSLVFTGE